MGKNLKRCLSKEDIQMISKHIEKRLNTISHLENVNQNHYQIPLYTHLDCIIQKDGNNKCWQGCGEIWILIHCC